MYSLQLCPGCSCKLLAAIYGSALEPKSERKEIKKKMLDLVDIYYLALDAAKSGNKVISNPLLICFVLM